jgi:hypothetical protein
MHHGMNLLLASEQDPERLFADMIPWLGIMCVVVLVLGTIALWLRSRSRNLKTDSTDGYTLGDLRRMHASGELTDEEFTKAREVMISSLRGPDSSDPGPSDDTISP